MAAQVAQPVSDVDLVMDRLKTVFQSQLDTEREQQRVLMARNTQLTTQVRQQDVQLVKTEKSLRREKERTGFFRQVISHRSPDLSEKQLEGEMRVKQLIENAVGELCVTSTSSTSGQLSLHVDIGDDRVLAVEVKTGHDEVTVEETHRFIAESCALLKDTSQNVVGTMMVSLFSKIVESLEDVSDEAYNGPKRFRLWLVDNLEDHDDVEELFEQAICDLIYQTHRPNFIEHMEPNVPSPREHHDDIPPEFHSIFNSSKDWSPDTLAVAKAIMTLCDRYDDEEASISTLIERLISSRLLPPYSRTALQGYIGEIIHREHLGRMRTDGRRRAILEFDFKS